MVTNTFPVIPESLQPYATEHFFEVSERFAGMSYAEITKNMPEQKLYGRYNGDHPVMHAALYRPKDFDPTHAVAVLYPFGNGQSPNMHIRNRVMQAVLGNNLQIIGIPNNTPSQQNYVLNEQQLEIVSSGDARPLAAGILSIAAELKVETLDVIGYSQGAFVGASVMQLALQRGDIEIKKALLAEPPNVIKRTPKELKKAFMGTGLRNYIRAVKDSGLPALNEVHGAIGVLGAAQVIKGLLEVQKGAGLPENRALHNGMTMNNMADVLTDQLWGGPLKAQLTIARAENSKVTPKSFDYRFVADYLAKQQFDIEDYGHEAADNITGVFALAVLASQSDLEQAA